MVSDLPVGYYEIVGRDPIAISIFLIFGTILLFIQIDYIQNKALGFDRLLRLTVPLWGQGITMAGCEIFADAICEPIHIFRASQASHSLSCVCRPKAVRLLSLVSRATNVFSGPDMRSIMTLLVHMMWPSWPVVISQQIFRRT